MTERPLRALFLDRLPETLREQMAALEPGALEQRLADALAACRAAWPALSVPPEALLPYLAERVSPDAAPQDCLERLAVADLCLACACLRGERAALAAFAERYEPMLDEALARLRATRDQIDEVKQQVRCRLFVETPEAGPAILGYTGRGPLGGWVRVTAVRAALRLMGREKREVPAGDELPASLPIPEDAELRQLKALYRGEFQSALEDAVRGLTPRERNLIRHHYVDGLSIDEIGLLYQAHRATVARWLARARESIAARTRSGLMQRLHVARPEYESIVRLVESQLHVSLGRLLLGDAETEGDESE